MIYFIFIILFYFILLFSKENEGALSINFDQLKTFLREQGKRHLVSLLVI